ncbi:MAG: uracil-DNA glycosylase [Geminicoccaceae bacterium]
MSPETARPAPGRDCRLCPRLAAFRDAQRAREPGWHNAPVPSFGPEDAGLLVVGLAPGLRGANRTGRPFTGDFAGEILYAALARHGFSRGRFDARVDDGLELVGCRIANAVRCVPPENKPVPAEISACRRFLAPELDSAPRPRVALALGRIAHDTVLRARGLSAGRYPFGHGATHDLPGGPVLVSSFHTSRYNVNTGKLTEAMFDHVVATARAQLDA